MNNLSRSHSLRVMQQQMAMMGASMGGAGAPVVQATPVAVQEPDSATKILKLKGLLDAGAITQAEFDQKKAELLNSL